MSESDTARNAKIADFAEYQVLTNSSASVVTESTGAPWRVLREHSGIPWSVYVGVAGMPGASGSCGRLDCSQASRPDGVLRMEGGRPGEEGAPAAGTGLGPICLTTKPLQGETIYVSTAAGPVGS